MKKEDGYIFVTVTELHEISKKENIDFPTPTDSSGWLTLESKVRKATGENYRLDPTNWGTQEFYDA